MLAIHGAACADVTIYTNKAQWQSAAGPSTAITFVEYHEFTIITDQYAESGILFTDGNDFIFTTASFPADGAGLVSASDVLGSDSGVHMSYVQPRNSIAFDFIGIIQFNLYNSGELVYASQYYVAGFTPFVGVTSTVPFDFVVAWDWGDAVVSIDNLYFGAAVPAPGSLLFLVGGYIGHRSGRRR